jgi:hypothetical protein
MPPHGKVTVTHAKEIDLSCHSGGEALTLYGAEEPTLLQTQVAGSSRLFL